MATSLLHTCNPTTFSPSIFGAEILSLDANPVTNFSASVPEAYRFVAPAVELDNASFCNVTVTYTHPGQNDSIKIEAWLPPDDWNGRLQAVGGGGWVAGRFVLSYGAMQGALADGYATVTTDAGLGNAVDASPWALLSPGNVNMYSLQNLASVSLDDEATMAKSLIRSFYGRGPEYSYWSGCSQGGRQGLMLAQRYPTAYDGIAAGAPAIYWTDLFAQIQWPQQVMNELGHYPYGCEVDAITDAAIEACDGLDGVRDGVISRIDGCRRAFDTSTMVGKTVRCSQANDRDVQISKEAAIAVDSAWQGMATASGKRIYHGLNPGADLTGNSPKSFGQPGLLATNCTRGHCVGSPSYLGQQWLQLFVAKDPEMSLLNLTRDEFDHLVHSSNQQYASLVDTDDADLTRFRDAGGKMITFHGLADNVIPPRGTEQYYNSVAKLSPNVHEFYRLFQVPGLGHCFGGSSGQPTHLFRQLRDWVENGTAPNVSSAKVTLPEGQVQDRIICPYPEMARFDKDCSDASSAECWTCMEEAGAANRHVAMDL